MTNVRTVVMSGPSGCGKGTLLTKLFKEFPDTFAFSVSYTTRNPRQGEANGKDYYFVSRDTFEKMITDCGFLEYAEFSGNLYGTSKKSVEDVAQSGKICILEVEVNGVKSIKKTNLKARYIFVKPPSLESLKERLEGRGTETKESLERRLKTAKEALDYASQPGSYDHIIVNNDLDIAYEKLKGILIEDIHNLQKERLKAVK